MFSWFKYPAVKITAIVGWFFISGLIIANVPLLIMPVAVLFGVVCYGIWFKAGN